VTQPTGNSGARVAQGVIGYASTASSSSVIALLKSSFACSCTLTDAASGATYNAFCSAAACATPSLAPSDAAATVLAPGVIAAIAVGSVAFVIITVGACSRVHLRAMKPDRGCKVPVHLSSYIRVLTPFQAFVYFRCFRQRNAPHTSYTNKLIP
jgi:hypothetical protein